MKKFKKMCDSKKVRMNIFGFILFLALVFPMLISNDYIIRLAIVSLMYGGMAMGLNLVSGVMGQISMGQAAFMGLGAYVSAILSKNFELTFIVCVIAAVVVSAIFGMLLGIPSLKLSGGYLVIVTLGFCEVLRLVELNWDSVTRGAMGIPGIARPEFLGRFEIQSNAGYYYLILVFVVIVSILLANLIHSHVGRAILSIREDEVAAEAMGINVLRYKVIAFSVSAAIGGFFGSFYAHYMRFVDPTSFNFDQSTSILSMVILGGQGSMPGSMIGAIVLTVIPECLRWLMDYRMLIYGLVLVLMMIYRPKGMLGDLTLAKLLKMDKKYAVVDEAEKEDADE